MNFIDACWQPNALGCNAGRLAIAPAAILAVDESDDSADGSAQREASQRDRKKMGRITQDLWQQKDDAEKTVRREEQSDVRGRACPRRKLLDPLKDWSGDGEPTASRCWRHWREALFEVRLASLANWAGLRVLEQALEMGCVIFELGRDRFILEAPHPFAVREATSLEGVGPLEPGHTPRERCCDVLGDCDLASLPLGDNSGRHVELHCEIFMPRVEREPSLPCFVGIHRVKKCECRRTAKRHGAAPGC